MVLLERQVSISFWKLFSALRRKTNYFHLGLNSLCLPLIFCSQMQTKLSRNQTDIVIIFKGQGKTIEFLPVTNSFIFDCIVGYRRETIFYTWLWAFFCRKKVGYFNFGVYGNWLTFALPCWHNFLALKVGTSQVRYVKWMV